MNPIHIREKVIGNVRFRMEWFAGGQRKITKFTSHTNAAFGEVVLFAGEMDLIYQWEKDNREITSCDM
jgi:hypothetical protein